MLHTLAPPVNAHTAALWGALKVCHVDNDTYCRCPRQDELIGSHPRQTRTCLSGVAHIISMRPVIDPTGNPFTVISG